MKKHVKTRLISRMGELRLDTTNRLVASDHEFGKILGEMAALGLIGELVKRVLNVVGYFNYYGHYQVSKHFW